MDSTRFEYVPGDAVTLRLLGFFQAEGAAPPYYWWQILLPDGTPVGKISLRLGQSRTTYYDGHIGYEIDAPYRGRRYALAACRMVTDIARCHGMTQLYLTCDENNAASYHTIEHLGGQLLEIATPPKDYLYYREGMPRHRIYRLSPEKTI